MDHNFRITCIHTSQAVFVESTKTIDSKIHRVDFTYNDIGVVARRANGKSIFIPWESISYADVEMDVKTLGAKLATAK